jgi:hypothetical protein
MEEDMTVEVTEDYVADAAKKFRAAERTMERRKAELFDAMRAYAKAKPDFNKSQVARITGYTREHVDRIVKAGADSE